MLSAKVDEPPAALAEGIFGCFSRCLWIVMMHDCISFIHLLIPYEIKCYSVGADIVTNVIEVFIFQVSKLETDVKLAQTSLENECSRTMELESAVESRHRMLEAAAARIADLEESQAGLQSQVFRLVGLL